MAQEYVTRNLDYCIGNYTRLVEDEITTEADANHAAEMMFILLHFINRYFQREHKHFHHQSDSCGCREWINQNFTRIHKVDQQLMRLIRKKNPISVYGGIEEQSDCWLKYNQKKYFSMLIPH